MRPPCQHVHHAGVGQRSTCDRPAGRPKARRRCRAGRRSPDHPRLHGRHRITTGCGSDVEPSALRSAGRGSGGRPASMIVHASWLPWCGRRRGWSGLLDGTSSARSARHIGPPLRWPRTDGDSRTSRPPGRHHRRVVTGWRRRGWGWRPDGTGGACSAPGTPSRRGGCDSPAGQRHESAPRPTPLRGGGQGWGGRYGVEATRVGMASSAHPETRPG